jgi:outer membrane lipoprotein-sorting protein
MMFFSKKSEKKLILFRMGIFLLLYLMAVATASLAATIADSMEDALDFLASKSAEAASSEPQGPREVRSLGLAPFLQSMFRYI